MKTTIFTLCIIIPLNLFAQIDSVKTLFDDYVTGEYRDVQVVGELIWITNGYGVMAYSFDTDNPETPPQEVLRIPTPGDSYGFHIVDSLCYVADSFMGLRIYNISDLDNIHEISTIENLRNAFSVRVRENLAFVIGFRLGLYVVNIDNPLSPEIVGFCGAYIEHMTIEFWNNFVLVSSSDRGFTYINVQNPADPFIERTYEEYPTTDFSLRDNIGFIYSNGLLLSLVVSDINNIIVLDTLDEEYNFPSPWYNNGYLYSLSSPGLRIVDAHDVRNLSYISSASFGLSIHTTPKNLDIYNGYAFCTGNEWGLFVFDIRNIEEPILTHRYIGRGRVKGIAKKDNFLYVADPCRYQNHWMEIGAFLYAFNLDNPARPVKVYEYSELPSYPEGIILSDSILFVTGSDCSEVFSISNPAEPDYIDHLGWLAENSIIDDTLMFTFHQIAVVVCDISDIRNMEVLREIEQPHWTRFNDTEMRGQYIYTCFRGNQLGNGLSIWDKSVPVDIHEVSLCEIGSSPDEIALWGDYAYLADYVGDLYVVSIEDPLNPEFAAQLDLNTVCYDLVAADGYLFSSNGYYGFTVYSLEDPAHPELIARQDTPGKVIETIPDLETGFLYVADHHDLRVHDVGRLTGLWNLVLSDDEHDFGEVQTNFAARWSLTIENQARQPAEIDSIDMSEGPFAVNIPDDLVLVPGARLELPILFAPDSAGDYAATLTITSAFRERTAALTGRAVGLEADGIPAAPLKFALNVPHPNPSNASITLSYTLPRRMDVELSVWDITGRKISVLDRGRRSGGEYRFNWRADGLTSGVYFIKLKSRGEEDVRKVNLVR